MQNNVNLYHLMSQRMQRAQGSLQVPQPPSQTSQPQYQALGSLSGRSVQEPTISNQTPDSLIEQQIRRMLENGESSGDTESLILKVEDADRNMKAIRREKIEAQAKNTPRFRCPQCQNDNQAHFIQDSHSGDTICLGSDGHGCGFVVQDRRVHEGSFYRNFEGEEDRSHHGRPPNPHFSDSWNSRTDMQGGIGSEAKGLVSTMQRVEQGLSNIGKDERRTREWYKDMHKKKAFDIMQHVAHSLSLHDIIVERAKEIFAAWRNEKEHLPQFQLSIAACLISAHRELKHQIEIERKQSMERQAGVVDRQNVRKRKLDSIEQRGNAVIESLNQTTPSKEIKLTAALSIVSWDANRLQEWLSSIVGVPKAEIDHFMEGICAAAEKEKKKKTGKSKTLGQLLMMANQARFQSYARGNAAAAKSIFVALQAEKRKSASSRGKEKTRQQSEMRLRQTHSARPGKSWLSSVVQESANLTK